MKSEQDLVQLSLGLKIEKPVEQRQIGKAIAYDHQNWPFPSIRSGRGVDEFRYQTHRELETQKREEKKRRKRKKKIVKPPVIEREASSFSTVPGNLEQGVKWPTWEKILRKAEELGIWQPER